MISFKYQDGTGHLTDERIREAVLKNASVLDQVKKEEGLDPMSTGWMDIDKWAGEASISRIEAIAREVQERADAFVVIGVGGSNNAARSVVEALKKRPDAKEKGVEIIWAGNTLSPAAMNDMLASLEGKDIYIDCIAKNFETLEPGASFRVLRKYLYKKYGEKEAAKRIIATGTYGSSLEDLCKAHGYTFIPFPTDIGGRYTAMSNVGLLPMACAGLDIRKAVRGAKKMKEFLYSREVCENPALIYASVRNLLYQDGYRVEMFSSFEPQMKWFFKWWIQLFAESEGKDGKGIFPAASEYSEELHSVGQFVQDGSPIMFETFLEIKEQQASLDAKPDAVEDGFSYLDEKDFDEINRASFSATRDAHSEKLPALTVLMDRIDEENLGEFFWFYQFMCVLSGRILGVDPFDQPGVEAYKRMMFRALGKKGYV